MRILLSNDDGVDAPGLAALYEAVADMGTVTVAAPSRHQSAAGHAITLKRPLPVDRGRGGPLRDAAVFSIDGTPADCVRLAARRLLPQPPQLVLAGINAGANVGINVFYSGTVAAAAEAAMMNLPAVALSVELSDGRADFPRAADIAREVLDRLLAAGLGAGELVNVNIPRAPATPRGIRVAKQSVSGIEDIYNRHAPDHPAESYLLADEYRFCDCADDDVAALAEGFVVVTPLRVDMTDHDQLAAFDSQIGNHAFKNRDRP